MGSPKTEAAASGTTGWLCTFNPFSEIHSHPAHSSANGFQRMGDSTALLHTICLRPGLFVPLKSIKTFGSDQESTEGPLQAAFLKATYSVSVTAAAALLPERVGGSALSRPNGVGGERTGSLTLAFRRGFADCRIEIDWPSDVIARPAVDNTAPTALPRQSETRRHPHHV